jgi:hypothetical protein
VSYMGLFSFAIKKITLKSNDVLKLIEEFYLWNTSIGVYMGLLSFVI